jgi:hypothetical protein
MIPEDELKRVYLQTRTTWFTIGISYPEKAHLTKPQKDSS